MTLVILDPGPLATIQDLGRPGLAAMGIGRSGAVDRPSLRLANAMVGNEPGAAAIEMTLGRLRARFNQDALIAIAGAPCPVLLDGLPARMGAAVSVRAGQTLRIGSPPTGLRSYLAMRGGVDVPEVLGSRATDMLSGIGPPILTAGMLVPIGTAAGLPAPRETEPESATDTRSQHPNTPVTETLLITPGPRADWFSPQVLQLLVHSRWHVGTDADRVGVRLAGSALTRTDSTELPPEPMVTGALQVPPGGQPILFLADHPVTGGYPVIAVLTDSGIAGAAQLRPGRGVEFRWA